MKLLLFNLKTDADDDVLGFTTEWINELAGHCERIFVITMAAGRIAVASNVEVHSVGKERGYSEPRRAAEFYRVLAKILRAQRIDGCFAHMMPLFAVMGWPLLRSYGVPIVLWYAHSHVPWILRLATLLSNRAVTSSSTGFRLGTSKLSIIGQGIDIGRFRPSNEQPDDHGNFVLLTVGRIAPVKRLEVLIEALARLPDRLADGRAVLARFVGNPSTRRDVAYADSLRRLADHHEVSERVEFLPGRPFTEIDQVYRDADVFVNSSDTDSVDKTVLEAMSSGLPVVTSNAAFTEIIRFPRANLCLVGKNDSVGLADRLRMLIDMPQLRRLELGLELRSMVERDHSLHKLCGRLIEELRNVSSRTV